MCTQSLTQAYSFWQQIKRSDDKFINESKSKLVTDQHHEFLEVNDLHYTIESVELAQSDKSEQMETIAIEPVRKKCRKRKPINAVHANTSATIIASEYASSSKNFAFPHFVIANVDSEMNTMNADVANDEFYCDDGSVCNDGDGGGSGNNDIKMQRKQIKTLKPSARITSDVTKINELLSMSLLDTDTDTKSTIFKCSHCPKAYAAPHHLMVHMRKSHLCQYCLATFSKITDLYGHVKEIHRTFECLICGKEFQSNGNLRQHMRKNHSIFLPAHISLLNVTNPNESDAC